MGRMPRIHIEGGLYLITVRGDYKEQLFKDDIDRSQYLELLSKYKEQYRFKLYSYILMPTFVHIFIELSPGTNISEIMHILNTTYTKYFNNRYNRRGHLFQGRFKSVLVEKATYLIELTKYIHLVPVLDGLTKNPEDYRWSSYPVYLRNEKDLVGIEEDIKEILNRVSPDIDDIEKQISSYKKIIDEASMGRIDQFRKRLQASWILGSKTFVESVKQRLREEDKRQQEEKRREWVESRPHKVFLITGGIAIFILSLVVIYLYRANLGLVNMFEKNIEKKEEEFIKRLKTEKERLREDLNEKYRADMISYQAMQKRLEIEKKRAREMEKRIEEFKKKKE